MRRIIVSWLLLFSFLVNAQNVQKKSTSIGYEGIEFVQGLSWQQVLQKAKTENKTIFVDCYTTWCAPCKAMEKQIYPLEKVGAFFNEHFISVKVQMDQAKKDDQFIKSWYDDAKKIEKEYSVNAYPTYLFVSPEGKPLHRATGGFSANKFLAIAADALNPETQSYTLAAKYDPAKMDTAEMRKVAIGIRRSAPEVAAKIALAYLKKLSMSELSMAGARQILDVFGADPEIQEFAKSYINTLNEQDLFKVDNIDLLLTFLLSSKDRSFKFFYHNAGKIDSIKNAGKDYKTWFAKNYIDDVIYKEEVNIIQGQENVNNNEPAWKQIEAAIQEKYGNEYSGRLMTKAKMNWYGEKKDYVKYCKYLVEYMEKYGMQMEFDWGLNNNAWIIFKFSNDRGNLEKALNWSNKAVSMNPSANWMDTYANILYKLGHKKQAILWEQISIKLAPDNKEIETNFIKMKNNEPTWSLQ